MADVSGGDSGDGNSAILGEVNTEVLGDLLHLIRGHPSEGKHSNLVGDVFPVTRRTCPSAGCSNFQNRKIFLTVLGQTIPELGSHGDNPVRHQLDVTEPLDPQLGVAHHLRGNPGPVSGRVAVHRSDQDLDLTFHPGGLVTVSTDHSEGAHPLSVQSHVLITLRVNPLALR